MSCVGEKKVTIIKSDPWFMNATVIKEAGFQESPLFGNGSTQFYWRADLQNDLSYSLHLYLTKCTQKKLFVKVKLNYVKAQGNMNHLKLKGVVSLCKSEKIGINHWSDDSSFVSTELKFEDTRETLYDSLSRQLLSLRVNSNLADITLVTTLDGEKFPAHKSILSARSPVFGAMFANSAFTESDSKQVEIEDITGKVMDAMLTFIYSASVDGIESLAGDLLVAADKYDLPLLVNACAESLVDNLSIESAARCFYLTELYKLEDAQKSVVNFIAANRPAVRKSPGWRQFIGPELLVQLFDLLPLP